MEEKKESGKHAHHEHTEHHEHHETSELKIDNNPDEVISKLGTKLKKNPWMAVSFVLGIVVIVLIIITLTGGTEGVGTVVAEQNVLDFAGSQGLEATIINSTDTGSFYEIVISIEGRDFPVYVTKDGKSMATSLVPLTSSGIDTPATPTTPTTPAEVPKSDKPVVELFVMSYCPYGTMAEKGIIPAIEALGSKIDFKLRFVSYIMHDKQEIDENTIDYCIQKEQSDKLLPYLKCFLKEGKSEACLTEVGINSAKLKACISKADTQFKLTANYNDKSTWSGGRYPPFDIDKELNIKYGVQGSPTLVINGVQSNTGRDPASYLSGICAGFITEPAECSEELSSTPPSAGFGYTETATSGTAATCG